MFDLRLGVKGQLQPFMARREAEVVIEPDRVGARLIARQLEQPATAFPAFFDRPFKKLPAGSTAPMGRRDPDALNLSTPHASARQAWNKGHLHTADDNAVTIGDGQQLVGVTLNGGKRLSVLRVHWRADVFAPRPQCIVGKQRNNLCQFIVVRPAKNGFTHRFRPGRE